MSSNLPVSVCIPVFNGSAFVAETIRSVLSQSYADFELLVLDNASTDDTPSILAGFKDDRLRIIRHKQNIGAVANFNAALREARFEWIKLVCADDHIYPECLGRQMSEAANADQRLVLLSCARDIIDDEGRRYLRRGYPGKSGRVNGIKAIHRTILSGTNLFGEPSSVLLRRPVALNVGGFNPGLRYCMDVDLWVRMLLQGDAYVDREALCSFRISGKSWSIALASKQSREYNDWVDLCRSYPGLKITRAELAASRLQSRLIMWKRRLLYRIVLGGMP